MYEARLQAAVPAVGERIERARERGGRTSPVALVAVTKGHDARAAQAAAAYGLTDCAENRVQDLEAKVEAVGRTPVTWHLIGHLQRNKVRRALPLFDLIHSIDSDRLAAELSAEAERAGVIVRGLVQVNTSGEDTKGGFSPDRAIEAVSRIAALPRIHVAGLMTMAPFDASEAVLRKSFGGARDLFERCSREVPGFHPEHLSMGMSDDFEVAVEEGSTMVRLGTILFGERAS